MYAGGGINAVKNHSEWVISIKTKHGGRVYLDLSR